MSKSSENNAHFVESDTRRRESEVKEKRDMPPLLLRGGERRGGPPGGRLDLSIAQIRGVCAVTSARACAVVPDVRGLRFQV